MEKTNKICWLRGHSFGALLLAILSIVSINCDQAQAEILRLDDSFTAVFTKSGWKEYAYLSDIVEQKDGKILLAGFYNTIDGTPINYISRFTPDGILDPDFNVGSGTDGWVTQVGVQSDGRIVMAGQFGEVNGVTVSPKLARLNENGTLDTSFTATANIDIWAMDISNNKITIGGQFSAVNGTTRNHVARLNADGTLDTTFNPGAGVTHATQPSPIHAVATIPIADIINGIDNDKVLVGGAFTEFNGSSYNNLVRLHNTGAVDTSFSIGSGFNNYVRAVLVQPDGKYLVGGYFTIFNGAIRLGIARLLNTGALDTSFSCAITGGNHRIMTMALQEDGRIVIGGEFTAVNGIARNNVARLNPDGSLDMEFDPGSGPDQMVLAVTSTRQNQVLIGGQFQSFNGNDQIQVLARFNSDSSLAGGAANPYTVFAGGKDDWKQVNLPRPTVNTGTLDLLVEGTLYYLSTQGPPVFLRLTYNSNLHNPVVGGFGKRWSFLYESSIVRQSLNQVRLRKGTGEQETYTTLTPLTSATPNTPITLFPVKGTFSQLICYGTYWLYKEKDTRFSYRFDSLDVDSPAYLTSISDRNNNLLTIDTDLATGRVQKITDPANRQISFTYTNGVCSRITVPDGRTIEFSYDGFGQLVQVKDMIGYLGQYTYDNGYITKTDLGDIGSTGGGHEMTFTYSDKIWEKGRYVSAIQSLSGKTLIEPVNNSINQVRWTNPRGQVTTVQTENGKTSGVADPSGALRSLSYVEGMLSSYTNGNGQSSSFTYDAMGNTTSVIDALGKTTSYSYDAKNNLTQRQDALGNRTFYEYDGNSNLRQVRYPNDTLLNFSYSPKGQLVSYANAREKMTGYAYDNYGNLTTMTAPDTGIITYSYSSNDQYSRCYRITDTRGQQKSYSYDNNNRITSVSYGTVVPYDAQVSYSYDALDLLSVTDELGKTTRVERNDDSLIVKSIDPLNNTTQLQYDGNGNLTKQINPLNQSIQTSYDAANHPVETTDPLNQTLKRTYDPDGNLISFRDALFQTTTFTYDVNNRLKSITNPLSQIITKTYDYLGRETETENSRGAKVVRQYDSIGNLTRKSYDSSVQVNYSYDAANNLLSSAHAVLGQKTYSYDDSGRVATITWPDAKSVSYTYDTEGNVDSVTYPDALIVSYSYDSFCRRKLPAEFRHGPRDDISPYPEKNNQATSVSWTGGGSLSMQYDAAGNILRETRSNGTESNYLYDGNRKITAIEHRGSIFPFLTIANTYDAAGRRLSSVDTQTLNAPFPSSSDTITYDAANQLLSFGSNAFSYDADGNVTAMTGGGSSLVANYDTENRPVTTTIYGVTTTYSFDGEGHPYRIVKNSVTNWYHWDHGGRLLFISDNSGNLVTRFVYRGNRLLAQQDLNGHWYFYHFDTNGNTIALTDSTGTVVAQYAYSAHGQYASLGTPPYNPFTFVGQFGVLEQGSNIYLMTNRLYLASTGRFLQRDPLGLTGGVNLYVYAGNNPVGRIDPQGTFEVDPGDVGDSQEMENPRVSEGTADLDTNELPYYTDSSVDPETADALAKDFAGGIDAALDIYGSVPGLPQGNFINAARATRDGKYAKATWETCKGLVGCIPGPGTAINITIDTTELLLSNAKGTSGGSAIGGVPTVNYSNR